MAALALASFAISVYDGDCTAAQSILLIGVMGALLPESVQRMAAANKPADGAGERRTFVLILAASTCPQR